MNNAPMSRWSFIGNTKILVGFICIGMLIWDLVQRPETQYIGMATPKTKYISNIILLVLGLVFLLLGFGDWKFQRKQSIKDVELKRTGIRGTAEIIAFTYLKLPSSKYGTQHADEQLTIDITVPGHNTYRKVLKQDLPKSVFGWVAEGKSLNVFVNPNNLDDFTIDWDSTDTSTQITP